MSFESLSHDDYALHFLSSHDVDDAKTLGLELDLVPYVHPLPFEEDSVKDSEQDSAQDARASVTGDPFAAVTISNATSTVTINVRGRTFIGVFRPPRVAIQDMNGRPATLFYRGNPPLDANQFWIQQYSLRGSGQPGRVVIELYSNNRIAAVCKTNDDNTGAPGQGRWN